MVTVLVAASMTDTLSWPSSATQTDPDRGGDAWGLLEHPVRAVATRVMAVIARTAAVAIVAPLVDEGRTAS